MRGAGGRLRHSDRGGRWLSRFILPRPSGQAPGANPYRPGPGGGGARGESLLRKLRETGRTVEADGLYRLDKSGMDAADVLAVEVGERASILEHDGGLSRDESERKAGGGRDGRVASREVGAMSSKEREARAAARVRLLIG